MMRDKKKTYEPDTPEWQLYENMIGALHLANSHAADAAKALQREAEARAKAEKFRIALEKLEDKQ